MNLQESTEHPVLLKVMQLSRPIVAIPPIITNDVEDFPGNLLNDYLVDDVRTVKELETVAAGQFLITPQIMQPVCLGETFSCYLYVYNTTKLNVKNVSLKVNLIPNSRSLPEYDHVQSNCVLGPGDSLNHVVNYNVKSLDTYKLSCEVSYLHSLTEKNVSYMKRYEFRIMPLFDVKHEFKSINNSDDMLLQIQVYNRSFDMVWLEKVSPHFSEAFKIDSLNPEIGKIKYILPGACCQFLYVLSPIPGAISDLSRFMPMDNVGILKIQWSSRASGSGQITTVQLKHKCSQMDDIKVSFTMPREVKLEQAFEFKCKIVNTCERVIELLLKLSTAETAAFFWSGISNKKICRLESGDSTEITLCAFPIVPGFQKVTGLSFVDTSVNQTYNFDDSINVFVNK